MWFYEVIVLIVVGTIGTVVGTILVLAFGLPLGIFGHWFGKNQVSAGAPQVKEVRKF